VLIDCDTCTVRGQGCDDCVVTVLLGAPPDWRGSDPTVVPMTRRPGSGSAGRRADRVGGLPGARVDAGSRHAPEAVGDSPGCDTTARDVARVDTTAAPPRAVVELDDVERRAVAALADFGLVPPLRHQDASTPGDRHVS
jgi:hypothetical protein